MHRYTEAFTMSLKDIAAAIDKAAEEGARTGPGMCAMKADREKARIIEAAYEAFKKTPFSPGIPDDEYDAADRLLGERSDAAHAAYDAALKRWQKV